MTDKPWNPKAYTGVSPLMMNLNLPAAGLSALAAVLAVALCQRTTPEESPAARPPAPRPQTVAVQAPPPRQVAPSPQRLAHDKRPITLKETDVIKVLRTHVAGVRRCLDQHARSGDPQEGRFRIHIKVRSSGEAYDVRVGPALRKCALGACLKAEVSGWRFPAFSGPMMPVDFPVHVRRHRGAVFGPTLPLSPCTGAELSPGHRCSNP